MGNVTSNHVERQADDPLTRASLPLAVILSLMIFVPAMVGWVFPTATQEPNQAAVDRAIEIDLNEADDRLLRLLPGVGPKTAGRLIATRERLGGFRTWADVETTPGVGPKTVEAIQPWSYLSQFDEMLVEREQ